MMRHPREAARTTDGHGPGFLEICVDSLAGARAAIAGGADQLELCSALALGGLTPSSGLARAVMAIARPAGVAVRAMVRPRPGTFDYDASELAVAAAEARALLDDDVDGLVFAATANRAVNEDALTEWIDAVYGASRSGTPKLTFHRAIDTVNDPLRAIDTIVAMGFDQILSSGGQVSAVAGVDTLHVMTAHAAGRCRVVAGAGIVPTNVGILLAHGLRPAIHASARPEVLVPADKDRYGFGETPRAADTAIVAALRRALDDPDAS